MSAGHVLWRRVLWLLLLGRELCWAMKWASIPSSQRFRWRVLVSVEVRGLCYLLCNYSEKNICERTCSVVSIMLIIFFDNRTLNWGVRAELCNFLNCFWLELVKKDSSVDINFSEKPFRSKTKTFFCVFDHLEFRKSHNSIILSYFCFSAHSNNTVSLMVISKQFWYERNSRHTSWKLRKTNLANLSRTKDRTSVGTLVPRTPRWWILRVTTARPEAKDTRQMLTP